MRRILWLLIPLLAMSPLSGAEEPRPWKLGVFPIVSAVTLFQRFAPLRDYLAEAVQHPIRLETAKDFPTFVQRTSRRRYDLLVTAPHFAVRAADEGYYRIVAGLKKALRGWVVVREDSPLHDLTELAGRVVATPPPQAIITAAGRLDIEEMGGLNGKRAPHYRAYRSHNAAYQAVLGGQADAAVVSENAVRVALDRGEPLRVLGKTRPLPNMAFLVARHVDDSVARRLVQALLALEETPRGRGILKRLGFPGYRPASLTDYDVLRPYLALLGSS